MRRGMSALCDHEPVMNNQSKVPNRSRPDWKRSHSARIRFSGPGKRHGMTGIQGSSGEARRQSDGIRAGPAAEDRQRLRC